MGSQRQCLKGHWELTFGNKDQTSSVEGGLVLDPQETQARDMWMEGDWDCRRIFWLHMAL